MFSMLNNTRFEARKVFSLHLSSLVLKIKKHFVDFIIALILISLCFSALATAKGHSQLWVCNRIVKCYGYLRTSVNFE